MAATGSSPSSAPATGQWFATTHWSVVVAAKGEDSPEAAEALEKLCRTYWPPIYSFIRREGYDATEAQDLTQGFFAELLTKDYLGHLRHQRGKFRSFLLTFVKHFLSAQRTKSRALKRGGDRVFLSLDGCSAEEHRLVEAMQDLNAEQVFDRRWAQAVLENSLHRLREEYERKGKGALFDRLKDIEPGERGELTYAELAACLGMTEEGIKTAVRRLRRRHGEILRDEIAHTVTRAEDVEEEIRHLLAMLRR